MEKVWQRVTEPAFPFHVPLSLALLLTHTLMYTRTHIFTEIHTHAGDKKELPWETEAWVKEGCWQ